MPTLPLAGSPADDAPPAAPDQPASTELLDLLAYVHLQNNQPGKAAVLLAARDVLVPGDTRVVLTLALAQLRSGRPRRALDTLDRLALAGAMDAPFHLVRAQALQALERPAEAASAMRAYVAQRAADGAPADAPPLPSTAAAATQARARGNA